jgi:hypothetical protein
MNQLKYHAEYGKDILLEERKLNRPCLLEISDASILFCQVIFLISIVNTKPKPEYRANLLENAFQKEGSPYFRVLKNEYGRSQ